MWKMEHWVLWALGAHLLKLYFMSLEGSCTSAFCKILVLLLLYLWEGLAITRDLCIQIRTEFCSCIEIGGFSKSRHWYKCLKDESCFGEPTQFFHLLLSKPARSPGASVGLQWQKPSWALTTASLEECGSAEPGAALHHLLHASCVAL